MSKPKGTSNCPESLPKLFLLHISHFSPKLRFPQIRLVHARPPKCAPAPWWRLGRLHPRAAEDWTLGKTPQHTEPPPARPVGRLGAQLPRRCREHPLPESPSRGARVGSLPTLGLLPLFPWIRAPRLGRGVRRTWAGVRVGCLHDPQARGSRSHPVTPTSYWPSAPPPKPSPNAPGSREARAQDEGRAMLDGLQPHPSPGLRRWS